MGRTQLISHIREFLTESGIVLNKAATAVHLSLPALFENAENKLTDTMGALHHRQYAKLITINDG